MILTNKLIMMTAEAISTPTELLPEGNPAVWSDDRLLRGYQFCSWLIADAAPAEGEPDCPITATLVRRNEPRHRRAVIYLHGWNDYFFQTHLADFWDRCGFDFYAVELRRYGRNLREGQLAGYITSLSDYEAELNEAYRLVSEDGHETITLNAHSTGGLIGALWASQTRLPINGVVLNSPWLSISGSALAVGVARQLVAGGAALSPTATIPVSESDFYSESIFIGMRGEWDYDLNYKSNKAFLPRFGWAKAIDTGQKKVMDGLDISSPVLMMTSAQSNLAAKRWDDSLKSVDLVLDVEKLAPLACKLGPSVTLVRITGGMHDLILSCATVREEVFAQISRWLGAYAR